MNAINAEKNNKMEVEELITIKENPLRLNIPGITAAAKDENDDDVEEVVEVEEETDDHEKKSEEDDWDPDFDEFDLPKSTKKIGGGKKAKDEEEDDFKVDDDFKDQFGGESSRGFNDSDDDY